MKQFGRYLWLHRRGFMLLALFGAVFAVIFSLYDLETEAVLYAVSWCAVIGLLFLAVSYSRYRARSRQLSRLTERIRTQTDMEHTGASSGRRSWKSEPESISPLTEENLWVPDCLLEREYQALLKETERFYRQELSRWQDWRQDSMDYYTAWVHQIKTPISVMRMLLQAEDTDEHRALLDELFRMEVYVEMALCYARLDYGGSDFVFRRCSLDEILRGVIHKYAPQFVRKRITLTFVPTGSVILTDEKWLAFVVGQLFSNALKYMEKGSVTVTADERDILCIADTGIGIAPEDLPRVFEKGFTGYNGRLEQKSTGLGLYLCRRTMDKLGGRIWAESTVGEGTRMYLDLHRETLKPE